MQIIQVAVLDLRAALQLDICVKTCCMWSDSSMTGDPAIYYCQS